MSNSKLPITLIGGRGKTGRRIEERLLAAGESVRVVSRSTAVPFDWADPSTYRPAVRGSRALYLSYAPDLSVPGAAEHVAGVCEAARAEGVQRVVLLAGRGEPQVEPAEAAVRNSGLEWTVLECAFFAQNFTESFLAPVDGVVYFPAGEVQEPFVDCDDIAEVAVAALTADGHTGRTYDLTGPRALSFAEAVQLLGEATGQNLRYQQVEWPAYAEMMAPHLPPGAAGFFVELFQTILDGHNTPTGQGVQDALRRPAGSFEAWARRVAG